MPDELPDKTGAPPRNRANLQRAKAILGFLGHYSKELTIAFVLAVVVAVLVEVYKARVEKAAEHTLRNNKAAVAELLAYDSQDKLVGTGSGLFINSNGTLITNFHVVEHMHNIEAKLPSGAFYKLNSIRGANKDRDIAILEFAAKDSPAVSALGDSDSIEVGQKVVTIGNPLGLIGAFSDGIISNPKLTLNGRDFIQFTAPISPGNSGGGLFDTNGNVIGLTSASLNISEGDQKGTAQNLNLAVPINVVKDALSGKNKTLTDESSSFYYFKGIVAEDHKDYQLARDNYQRAVDLAESHNEKFAAAYLGLGGSLYELGEYDLEVENYLKAAKAEPENSDAWYYLGTAFEDTGDYKRAIDAYEKALQLEPDNKEALHDLGLLYLAIGKKTNASALISKLMSLDQGLARKLNLLLLQRAR